MKLICTVLIILYSSFLYAQDKIELTCFTLGLVNDYFGRMIVKDDKLESTRIDQFHETQAAIMDVLDSLINEENKSRDKAHRITARRIRAKESNCTDCHAFFNYYSKELSQDLNKFYKFRFSHSWDLKERKLYSGRIKIQDFKNDAERISFLSGAYLRSGTKAGDIFTYHLANSVEQFDLIVKSIKKLNGEIKDVKVEGGTPASQKVYFIPSGQLKSALDHYDELKRKIEERYSSSYKDNNLN